MGGQGTNDLTSPVFAHHVRAILARMAQEDREAIGAHLKRAGFRDQTPGQAKARKKAAHGGAIDFFTASPLTGRDRQPGGFRIPHVDFKPITPTIAPTSKDGRRWAHKVTHMTAAEHFDYVTDGAKIEIAAHLDYIARATGVSDPLLNLAIDALDELAERNEKNKFNLYTNIPGGWKRARSLFEAAEQIVPAPKTYELLASTADWEVFANLQPLATTPDWLRGMEERLKNEHDAIVERAHQTGNAIKHRQVVVSRLNSAEAFDRLEKLDSYPALKGKIGWKQGRTQRCQYRFVGELPDGLSPRDRYAILSSFGEELSNDGWMVVGAIHQPDETNDKRNFHIHIDLYDRKAEWLEDEKCWDFAYTVAKNGKQTHPYRHNKIRYLEWGDEGQPLKYDVAGLMRTRFIDAVNAVAGERPGIVRYRHGTYKANDIDLTPLDHMGNRAMGLERRGVITEVGSRNARRIAADEASACEKRAAEAEAALAREMALIRSSTALNQHTLAAAERYERLQRRLVRRKLQAGLAETVIAMARSRADAVVRTLTPAPGCRMRLKPHDATLVAEAKRHLGWVQRNSPSQREREAERRSLVKAVHRASNHRRTIETDTCVAASAKGSLVITYHPRGREKAHAAARRHSCYDDKKRGRLSAWLAKHAADPDKLVFDGNEVRLGKAAPPSIDTFMGQFASEPYFQDVLLLVLRDREIVAAGGVAEPAETFARNVLSPQGVITASQGDLLTGPHDEVTRQVPDTLVSDGEGEVLERARTAPATDESAPEPSEESEQAGAPCVTAGASGDVDLSQSTGEASGQQSNECDDVHRTKPMLKKPSLWRRIGKFARLVGSTGRPDVPHDAEMDRRRNGKPQGAEQHLPVPVHLSAPPETDADKVVTSRVIATEPVKSAAESPVCQVQEPDLNERRSPPPSHFLGDPPQLAGSTFSSGLPAVSLATLAGRRGEASASSADPQKSHTPRQDAANREVQGRSLDTLIDEQRLQEAQMRRDARDRRAATRNAGAFAQPAAVREEGRIISGAGAKGPTRGKLGNFADLENPPKRQAAFLRPIAQPKTFLDQARAVSSEESRPAVKSRGPRSRAEDDDGIWPIPGKGGQER